MKRLFLVVIAGFAAGAALARLPPPTPEEKAKLEKAAEEKKAQTEKEKKDLERAQERVARQYRAENHKGAPPQDAAAEKLKNTDVPKAAKQPTDAPPEPYAGRKSSPEGQAHSSN